MISYLIIIYIYLRWKNRRRVFRLRGIRRRLIRRRVSRRRFFRRRRRKTGSADFGKSAGNYIKSIQTDFIQLDPSIHPSPSPPCGAMMDRYDCRREVEESVDYEILCGRYGREDMDEMVELITDGISAGLFSHPHEKLSTPIIGKTRRWRAVLSCLGTRSRG